MIRAAAVALLLLAAFGERTAAADIHVYPRAGAAADDAAPPQGPGVVVMGGGLDVDRAFVWMHDTLAGSSAATSPGRGDVVILRDPDPNVGQDDAYAAYLLGVAPFRSVQTVTLGGTVTGADLAQAATLVDRAEAVFFAGGDQRDYVLWKGPLLDAVQRVYDRGGVVGGTSAGAALWGQFVNDAIGQHQYGSVTSADALADPFEPSITFSHDLFRVRGLASALVDTHFKARDRFGRLAVFVGRILADGGAKPRAVGVGVEEDSALLIDRNGLATLALYDASGGGAWILEGGPARVLAPKTPIVSDVLVTRLTTQGATYDLVAACGGEARYRVAIDAKATPPLLPADPYSGGGAPLSCAAPSPGGAVDGGAGGTATSPPAPPSSPTPPTPPTSPTPNGGGAQPSSEVAATDVHAPGAGCSCDAASSNAMGSAAWLGLAAAAALAGRRRRHTRR